METNVLRRLLGRGSIYTAGSFLEAGAALLVLPTITRLLSPEQFGLAATALVVAQVVMYLAPLGISTAVPRMHFDGEDGPEKSRVLVLWSLLIAIVFAALLDATGSIWAPAVTGTGYVAVLRIAVWMSIPGAVVIATMAAFTAQDRPSRVLRVSLTNAVGGQIMGLVLVITVDGTAASYLAGLAIGRTVAALGGLVMLGIKPRWLARLDVLRTALAIGLPTVSHSVALYLLNAGSRLVIQHVDGLAAVARYQVAYAVGSVVLLVLNAATLAWSPLIWGQIDDRRRWRDLAVTADAVLRLAGLLGGLLAVASPLALLILAPASYDRPELVPVSGIIALAGIPMAIYVAAHIVLFQKRKTRTLAYAAPIATALNLAACALLVPIWGLVGAAICSVLAVCVLAAIVGAASERHERVPWLTRSALEGVAMAAMLAAIGIALPADGLAAGIRVLVAVAVGGLIVRELRRLLRTPEVDEVLHTEPA